MSSVVKNPQGRMKKHRDSNEFKVTAVTLSNLPDGG